MKSMLIRRRVHALSMHFPPLTHKQMRHATTAAVELKLPCQRPTLLLQNVAAAEERKKTSKERFNKFFAWLNSEETEGFATALCDRQWRVGLVSGRGRERERDRGRERERGRGER